MRNSSIDPKDSEAKLILSAIIANDLTKIKARGINADSLLVWGEVFSFVDDFAKKYDKMPTAETLYLKFPGFPQFSNDGVDQNFLIDTTVENAKKKKLRELLAEAADNLDIDINDTLSKLGVSITDLRSDNNVWVRYLDENSIKRLDEFIEKRERVAAGGFVGLSTGINAFDQNGICLMDGEFWILIGPPGAGKSFLLEKMCISAYLQGKKVLYVCPEMPRSDVGLRFDVMVGRHYGYVFSLEALRKGDPSVDVDKYSEFLINHAVDKKRWQIVDSVDSGKFTVDKLEALVKDFNPDIIGIDSLTQFTTMAGALAVGWVDMIEITNAIKTLTTASHKIFVAIGPSTGDTFDSAEPATIGQMGLSRGAVYKPDVVISISKDLSPHSKTRYMRLGKMRNGVDVPEVLEVHFEPDCGYIA